MAKDRDTIAREAAAKLDDRTDGRYQDAIRALEFGSVPKQPAEEEERKKKGISVEQYDIARFAAFEAERPIDKMKEEIAKLPTDTRRQALATLLAGNLEDLLKAVMPLRDGGLFSPYAHQVSSLIRKRKREVIDVILGYVAPERHEDFQRAVYKLESVPLNQVARDELRLFQKKIKDGKVREIARFWECPGLPPGLVKVAAFLESQGVGKPVEDKVLVQNTGCPGSRLRTKYKKHKEWIETFIRQPDRNGKKVKGLYYLHDPKDTGHQ